jgi:N-acetyl-anhydromuramyl-L-alanine amidase AmpD
VASVPTVKDDSGNTSRKLYSRRRVGAVGLVVHTTAGLQSLHYLQGGVLSEGRIASADALIDRDGTIHVLVPFDCYSYHSGQVRYYDRNGILFTNINELFLGVELECALMESCTEAQYHSLAGYILNKAEAFHWQQPYAILAHGSVAFPLGRRSDPTSFDWGMLHYQLNIVSELDWWKERHEKEGTSQ